MLAWLLLLDFYFVTSGHICFQYLAFIFCCRKLSCKEGRWNPLGEAGFGSRYLRVRGWVSSLSYRCWFLANLYPSDAQPEQLSWVIPILSCLELIQFWSGIFYGQDFCPLNWENPLDYFVHLNTTLPYGWVLEVNQTELACQKCSLKGPLSVRLYNVLELCMVFC